MKLIMEVRDNSKIVSDDNKNLYIEGIFIETELKNQNGRIYENRMMAPIVDKYIKEKVSSGRAFGELEHPENVTINLDRISHIITELRADGNNYIGKARITKNTPCGSIAYGIIEAGGILGVSTRGYGDVIARNGANYVENYNLVTAADIVSDPSAPHAFVNGIYEGKEWIWSNGALSEKQIQSVKDSLDKKYSDEKVLEAFKQLISSIGKKV
jgi:hypothetical protein